MMSRLLKIALAALVVVLTLGLLCIGTFRLLPADERDKPFRSAVADRSVLRARLFLTLGSDIDQNSSGSGTALHIAAMLGDTAMITFLLQHGANPNAVAKFSVTPLYEARFNHHPEAERLLLAWGANPDTSAAYPP